MKKPREPKPEDIFAGLLDDVRRLARESNITVDVRQLEGIISSMKPENNNYVAYFRVSTRRQGASGLGLEAQKKAVTELVASRKGRLVAEHTEVESGKVNERPELAAAIAASRRQKCTLVVAKLDRLSRSMSFTAQLLDSGIDFLACDNPFANRLTLHIMAAIAEHERMMVSARTREALKAAKERGVELGSNRPGHWEGREEKRLEGLEKARQESVRSARRRAEERYVDLVPVLKELRAEGLGGETIGVRLDERGIAPPHGGRWTGTAIRRLLKRFSIK